MKIAFSPCPNDTFVFHAWVHNLIPGAPKLDVTYADIDITNILATGPEGPDIVKISYGALPWVLTDYALLPCGGALGRGCGPLLLVGAHFKQSVDMGPEMLTGKRVAVPSEKSTAYLLFRLWTAQKIPGGPGEIIVMPFQEIMPAVKEGLVDAGLVIHEARFTYPEYGLHCFVDLGQWWEEDTGYPIPLGAIIARRSLNLPDICHWIRESVNYAWRYPEASRGFVMRHAQEISPEVAQAHIKLYVNAFTEDFGESGAAAVQFFLKRAAGAGLVPGIEPGKIF